MRDLPTILTSDLESEQAELLPARETLCSFACTNVTNIVGVNVALAVNAASIGAQANAAAYQYLAAVQ